MTMMLIDYINLPVVWCIYAGTFRGQDSPFYPEELW